MSLFAAIKVIKAGTFIWKAVKPITSIKKKLNKRRARKGKPLFIINEERDVDAILNSLKSKTVWFGIVTSAWGLAQVFIAAGNFSTEAVVSLLSGVAIIILRAVTTKPLADK